MDHSELARLNAFIGTSRGTLDRLAKGFGGYAELARTVQAIADNEVAFANLQPVEG
jgi:hypothetical protein